MAKYDDIRVRLSADSGQFERGFKSAEAAAKAFEKELAKVEAAQRDMASQEAAAYREQDRLVKEQRTAQVKIGTAFGIAGAAIAAGIGAAISTAADFDQAMSNVAAATGESASSMGQLRAAAIKAGADTVYSATEAAGAIEELSKAGVSTQDILNGGLTGALNLAAAGGIEVKDAAEAAASAMTQFGLSGKAVPHIADLLAAAAGKAQGGVSDMNYALGQSGTVAAQFGLTVEQTTGTLASFASAGLLGSDAGTSFKTMLLALANPTDKAAGAMKDLGISAYDSGGQFVGIANLADQLKTNLSGLSEEQRNAALATIFGSDAMRAASVLYQEGGQGITDWISRVNDSGFAADTAATRMDNLKGDIETLKGSFQTAMITLGGGKIGDAARTLAEQVDSVIDKFNEMPDAVKSDTQFIGALGAAIFLMGSAALIAVPKIEEVRAILASSTKVTNAATTAMTRFGTVASMTALTVGAVWAGTQIGDAITKVTTTADQTTNALMNMGNGAKAAASSFDIFDTDFFGWTYKDVTNASDAIDTFGKVAHRAAGGGFMEFYHTLSSLGSNKRDFTDLVSGLDQSLADMVQSGNADAAAVSFKKLRDEAVAQGVPVDEITGKFKLYEAALDSTAAAQGKAETQMKFWTSGAAEASGVAQELTEDEKKLRDERIEGINSFRDGLGAYTEALDAKQKKEQESAEATAEATKDGKDSWKDYAKDVSLTVQEYIDSLQKQVDAQNAWSGNLLSLTARGLPDELLQQLTALGLQGAPIVQKFVDATGEEFQKLVTTWPGATADAASRVADTLNTAGPILRQIAEASGQATAKGYADKLADGTMTLTDVIGDYARVLADNIPDEATTTLKVDGMDVSRDRIIEIKRTMDTYLKDKTITITAAIRAATTALAGTGQRVAQGAGGSGGLVLASGGPVWGPGGPTDDAIPAMLSNGEFVVKASSTKKHRNLVTAINNDDPNVPQFASGGAVDGSKVSVSLPNPADIRAGMNAQLVAPVKAVQAAADAAMAKAISQQAGPVGAGAARWSGTVLQALGMLGMPAAWLGMVLHRLNQESGGNPNAINNWDINAKNGTPSQGLMQTIPGTFRAYHVPGTSGSILDPLANIAAGLNYASHRYAKQGGVPYAMMKKGGYSEGGPVVFDQGGMANGVGFMPKQTIAPERVLSPRQTKAFEALVGHLGTAYANGGLVTPNPRGQALGPGGVATSNSFDLGSYLSRGLAPTVTKVDDTAARNSAMQALKWASLLAIEENKLADAKTADENATELLRVATDAQADAQRDVTSAASDSQRAVEKLQEANKQLLAANQSKDKERIASAEQDRLEASQDLAKAKTDEAKATTVLTGANNKLTLAKNQSADASAKLATQEETTTSVRNTSTDATDAATDAEQKLAAAKAESLSYAQKIADSALSGSNLVKLFSDEDPVRAARFAQAAYDASVAQAQAATDAADWQSSLDAVAAAGLKVASTQKVLGASYTVTKGILTATRTEIEKLALSYGFTTTEAQKLADSALDVGASAEQVVTSMERNLKAINAFAANIKTLRTMGLDETLIAQLVDAGAETGGTVAESIIAAGQTMIARMNSAQAGLTSAANSLGKQEAQATYTPPAVVPTTYPAGNAPVISRVTRLPAVVLKADGGLISGPGGPRDDKVPMWASPGEFVVKAAAVNRYGTGLFQDLNAMKLAVGGQVGRGVRAGAQPVVKVVLPESSVNRGVGSLFAGNLVVNDPVDLDMVLAKAKFALGGALGFAGGGIR